MEVKIVIFIIILLISVVAANLYIAGSCADNGGAVIQYGGKVGCVYYDK